MSDTYFLLLSVRRIAGTIIVFVLSLSLGLASALEPNIFANQDATWAQALIVSGCFFLFLVIRYGILRFRKELYNSVSYIYIDR